jgi:putative endonuclease
MNVRPSMTSYMYILERSDGSYFTGSTMDLEKRLAEHEQTMGKEYEKKRRPIRLAYYEVFPEIKEAFYREKQLSGWNAKKKKALIENRREELLLLLRNYGAFGKPRAG